MKLYITDIDDMSYFRSSCKEYMYGIHYNKDNYIHDITYVMQSYLPYVSVKHMVYDLILMPTMFSIHEDMVEISCNL